MPLKGVVHPKTSVYHVLNCILFLDLIYYMEHKTVYFGLVFQYKYLRILKSTYIYVRSKMTEDKPLRLVL